MKCEWNPERRRRADQGEEHDGAEYLVETKSGERVRVCAYCSTQPDFTGPRRRLQPETSEPTVKVVCGCGASMLVETGKRNLLIALANAGWKLPDVPNYHGPGSVAAVCPRCASPAGGKS